MSINLEKWLESVTLDILFGILDWMRSPAWISY